MNRKALIAGAAVFSLLFIGMGCTTNIEPLSGPIGTEVRFSPAPGDDFCGWWIYLYVGNELRWENTEILECPCFTIPDVFVPGEQVRVKVDSGLYYPPLGECVIWGPIAWGSFLVTE